MYKIVKTENKKKSTSMKINKMEGLTKLSAMTKVLALFLLILLVNGESFNGIGVRRTLNRKVTNQDGGSRSFIAPEFDGTPSLVAPEVIVPDFIQDVPELAEWDDEFSDLESRLIIISGRGNKGRKTSFDEESEVASLVGDTCRRCMVSGNMACVEQMCSLTNILAPVEKHGTNVEQKAFVTGISMHGDILCSLCKQSRDPECTIKFCEDPERDKHVEQSGVECMQGFCRWQKETVVSAGFNNYYNAWWQPNNLIVMFDQFTRELASAYQDIYVATHRAMHVLG